MSAAHPIEIPCTAQQKRSSLIACAATGVGVVGALKALRWLWDQFAFGLPQPDGIPAAWWLVDQRAASLAIRELFVLALFAIFVRARGMRLVDLGFRHRGTRTAWLAAFAVLVLGLLSHSFVRSGPYPLASYTVFAALAIGIPVALLEESVYRGFAVRTLQAAGFGIPVQILFTGVLFGVVHISYTAADWTVPVFTAVLGCLWSWIYIKGANSIWPTLVTHAINDAVIMPYFYMHGIH